MQDNDLEDLLKQYGGSRDVTEAATPTPPTSDSPSSPEDLEELLRQSGGYRVEDNPDTSNPPVTITPDSPPPDEPWYNGYKQIPGAAAIGIRGPVKAVGQFATGVKDAAVGIASTPIGIVKASMGAPQTPGEALAHATGGSMGLAAHRLLIEPTVENAKKAWESMHNIHSNSDRVTAAIDAIRAIPIAGPQAAEMLERVRKGDTLGAVGEAATFAALPLGEDAAASVGSIPKALGEIAKKGWDYFDTKIDPRSTATKGLNPADLKFQRHVGAGLSELNQGKIDLGVKRVDVPTGLKILDHRTDVNNKVINDLVKPQETVKVPGSGTLMRQQQIDAIPDDIKHNPTEYQKVVDKVSAYHPEDYTIGELNKLRSELGATQSSFYGKDTSGALTMDAGTRAIDIARGNSARSMFYHAMDNYGLGGGVEAAETNSRIGSIIHMKDALEAKMNTSMAEKGSNLQTNVVRPFRRTVMRAELKGVDEHLDAAVKAWDKTPVPVGKWLENRVKGTVGAQSDLLPLDRDPNALLQPPRRTSSTIKPSTYQVQVDAMRAARSLPPQDMSNFSNSQGMLQTTPEEQYLNSKNLKSVWDSSTPSLGNQRAFPTEPLSSPEVAPKAPKAPPKRSK